MYVVSRAYMDCSWIFTNAEMEVAAVAADADPCALFRSAYS